MDSQSLHTLFTIFTALGFVLTGAGGAGLWYFSRMAGSERELQHGTVEVNLRAKVAALQKTNEELQQRLRVSERREPVPTPEVPPRQPLAGAPPGVTLAPPTPAQVKAPFPSPLEWAETSVLENLIESSNPPGSQARPLLGEKQRQIITAILREYTDRAITIQSVTGDTTGLQFAEKLKGAFIDAGWRVSGVEQMVYSKPPEGLFINSGTSSVEEAIIPHEALTTAGFVVSRCVDSNLKGGKTVLLVGVGLK